MSEKNEEAHNPKEIRGMLKKFCGSEIPLMVVTKPKPNMIIPIGNQGLYFGGATLIRKVTKLLDDENVELEHHRIIPIDNIESVYAPIN
ncbi:MAG: hypothetical protein WC460_03405 [Patescibacteria group bacterium]